MKNLSIRDLERLSGIKAHTIRTWEQRYMLARPGRSASNIRRYTVSELRSILKLALLTKNGYRISQLAKLDDAGLESRLKQLSAPEQQHERMVINLLIHMYEFNIDAFEAELDHAFALFAGHQVVKQVIFPFLQKTGLLCQGNAACEEHLAVTAIRKKLVWATETARRGEGQEDSVLLFLPGTRQLDLGLLYLNYLVQLKGRKVWYMGNDVNLANLRTAFSVYKPKYVYTYFSNRNSVDAALLAMLVEELLPDSRLVYTLQRQSDLAYMPSTLQHLDFEKAVDYLCES